MVFVARVLGAPAARTRRGARPRSPRHRRRRRRRRRARPSGSSSPSRCRTRWPSPAPCSSSWGGLVPSPARRADHRRAEHGRARRHPDVPDHRVVGGRTSIPTCGGSRSPVATWPRSRPIGPDTFCYLLLPPPGCDTLTIDNTFTWEQHAHDVARGAAGRCVLHRAVVASRGRRARHAVRAPRRRPRVRLGGPCPPRRSRRAVGSAVRLPPAGRHRRGRCSPPTRPACPPSRRSSSSSRPGCRPSCTPRSPTTTSTRSCRRAPAPSSPGSTATAPRPARRRCSPTRSPRRRGCRGSPTCGAAARAATMTAVRRHVRRRAASTGPTSRWWRTGATPPPHPPSEDDLKCSYTTSIPSAARTRRASTARSATRRRYSAEELAGGGGGAAVGRRRSRSGGRANRARRRRGRARGGPSAQVAAVPPGVAGLTASRMSGQARSRRMVPPDWKRERELADRCRQADLLDHGDEIELEPALRRGRRNEAAPSSAPCARRWRLPDWRIAARYSPAPSSGVTRPSRRCPQWTRSKRVPVEPGASPACAREATACRPAVRCHVAAG